MKNNKGRNPILSPQWHIPDGEAHVMPDGKLYLYGSCDSVKGHYCSPEYYVVSTDDMKQWTIHDKSFDVSQVSWAKGGGVEKKSRFEELTSFEELPDYIKEKIPKEMVAMPMNELVKAIKYAAKAGAAKEACLFAPDAIECRGKYFLFFCLSDETEGIAVSDRPAGPFENAVRLPVMGIDPAIFIDDDGSAYYYWGQFKASGTRINLEKRELDMDCIVHGIVNQKEHFFHEGSSVRKRGDTYYYIFADESGGKPTALGYATSKSPLGPFTYKGIIIDNEGCDPQTWNNHGSIEEFQGQWYVFYHRSSQNSNEMRNLCAERIYFDEKGEIGRVKMTSQGAGEPIRIGETISAGLACEVFGGAYIDVTDKQEWAVYLQENCALIFRYLEVEVETGFIHIETDESVCVDIYLDDKLCGSGYTNQRIQWSSPSGRYELRIVFNHAKGRLARNISLSC